MASESETRSYTVVVSEDKMLAVLEAYAPVEIAEEEVLRHIQEEGIVAGVDAQAVRAFVEDCDSGKGEIRATIAQGAEPQHGKDGEILWTHEREQEEKPAENERMDWYEQSDLISAAKDGLIAKLLLPTKGTAGVNVLGKVVECKDGKPATLNAGANVVVSDDGARFTAAASGMLVVKGKSVKVDPVYKVKGDVDFETGNIDFDGQVAIGGNVLDLFKVKATGDVTIRGCVEGATLESKGNIAIKGGIAGKNQCTINLDGDLTAFYINSARVKCKGDVLINVEILNSTVEASGVLTVKQKGIIGGRVIAADKVECNALGSDAGPPTEVVLGQDSVKESRLDVLQMKDSSLSAEIKELAGKASTLERIKNRLPADKRELLTKMSQEQQGKEAELDGVRSEVRCLVDEIRDLLMNASLFAKEMIYAGVVIEIAGVRKEIIEPLRGPIQVKFDVAKRRILLLSKESR